MPAADPGQGCKPAVETVAVVGAGLGGLAVAIALHTQGIQVQVYEKARELRPIGAGLSLFPNGLNTLEAISPGIVQALIEAGSVTAQVNLRKENGDLIAQTPMALREEYHQPMLDIRWSRLQEILAARLPREIIHLNHRCVGFKQRDDQVEVEFEHSQQSNLLIHADLLIGADGVQSAVRQIMIGDGPPRYAGRLSWRAVVPFRYPALAANEVTIMTGAAGKIFTLLDVGEGFVFWSAAALSTDDSLRSTPDQVKQQVLTTFAGWAEPVAAIVEITPAEAIVERPICDRPPLKYWSQGRVTLLGDAAHPMVPSLGQGANMAFEDAWELTQCLVQHSTIAEALTCYENRRIQRTQLVQAYSAAQGNRSYDPDGATFLQDIIDQSKVGPSEFDHWLYSYQPLMGSAFT